MKAARLVAFAVVVTVPFLEGLAETPAKIDFGRDVQPLLRAHCIDCHGPTEQKNGFRLDRRSDAMKGGTLAMIGPGNAAASRLYLKLVSNEFGPRMPPDGPLSPEEINIIKSWIDQGAKWPDELAGETPAPPPDPKAARLMTAVRDGDRSTFLRMLRDDPAVVRLKGPGGSTPLMYAVLYADADSVRLLLEKGADVNVANEAGATALMWAVDDLEKTHLLLARGANANALSADSRTPLLIASGRFGSAAVVKLLLEHGASPNAVSPSYRGPLTPLRHAAEVGDADVLKALLDRGVDVKSAGPFPLIGALDWKHANCVELLTRFADRGQFTMGLLFLGPPFANAFDDAQWVRLVLDQGADSKARDPAGRTALMLAASADCASTETVKLLIERGADLSAKSPSGQTALDFARQHGQTPIVELLTKAGAPEGEGSKTPAITAKPAASVRAALERSIPLLQHADVTFLQKAGCVACHHNTLTAMTVALARQCGIPVDDAVAGQQRKTVASYIENWRERALQGLGIPGDSDTVAQILLGLAAEKHRPDMATDALARYLRSKQSPEGRWRLMGNRPPLESSEFEITAVAMRSLQIYAPRTRQREYEKAIDLAVDWLKKTPPKTTADRVFQLRGLRWSGRSEEPIRKAVRELLSEQRTDGGWAQLPSLESDAYATGQALVALHEAGAIAATEDVYQRGIRFLINTQLEDGSWYVKSRSLPFQPYFESGFPHGPDQWISAAATNWASMALIPAIQ